MGEFQNSLGQLSMGKKKGKKKQRRREGGGTSKEGFTSDDNGWTMTKATQ